MLCQLGQGAVCQQAAVWGWFLQGLQIFHLVLPECKVRHQVSDHPDSLLVCLSLVARLLQALLDLPLDFNLLLSNHFTDSTCTSTILFVIVVEYSSLLIASKNDEKDIRFHCLCQRSVCIQCYYFIQRFYKKVLALHRNYNRNTAQWIMRFIQILLYD